MQAARDHEQRQDAQTSQKQTALVDGEGSAEETVAALRLVRLGEARAAVPEPVPEPIRDGCQPPQVALKRQLPLAPARRFPAAELHSSALLSLQLLQLCAYAASVTLYLQ